MGDPLPSGMGTKKQFEVWQKIAEQVITVIVFFAFENILEQFTKNEWGKEIAVLVAAIINAPVAFGLHWACSQFQKNRDYGKYEGYWLQVIPDLSDRPFTIFKFEYNQEDQKYRVMGYNFYKNLEQAPIEFIAYRLVERSKKNGFYYITDHDDSVHKNGLGKLWFRIGQYDGLTRADGYFYDVSDENNTTKYSTHMVKCDKQFAEKIRLLFPMGITKIEELQPLDIMKQSVKFAEKELENYRVPCELSAVGTDTAISV